LVREAATGEVLLERAEAIGVATNNAAEYAGLIAGLQAAADLGAVEVEVRMDSKLVVEQMAGRWQIKHPGLRPLAAQAATLVKRFDTVRFTWIPRGENRRADALANAAMDGLPAPEDDIAAPVTPPRSWLPPSSTVDATRLVLVRHGQTALTAERRYSGRGDVPLSAIGVAQARATAARVSALVGPPPVVVSSPLARCASTARMIAEAADGTVTTEADLVECDFGDWEGLTFAEVRERWPQQLDAWLGSSTVAPPNGESFEAVAARVRRTTDRLTAAHRGNTVVVVSHVTPIKLILRDALLATDALLHRLYLDPAGISIVDMWPDGGVAVRTINDTAHLTVGW
jgi:probable phosphoglycerate mutase